MVEKIPNCGIKDDHHKKYRRKTLKTQYREVVDMLGHADFGFGWDDINKCVTYDLNVWNGWAKVS